MTRAYVIALIPTAIFLLCGFLLWVTPGMLSPILRSSEIPVWVRGIGGLLVIVGGVPAIRVLDVFGGGGLILVCLGLAQSLNPLPPIRLGASVSPRRTGLFLTGIGLLALAVSLPSIL